MFNLEPGGGGEVHAAQSAAEPDVPEIVIEAVKPLPEKPKPVEQEEPPDAGAPEDAGAEEANDGGPEAVAMADAESDGAGSEEGKEIGDPVALSGSAGKVVDANANVQLQIYNEKVRSHPLGRKIGKLLGRIGQWRDFFGPTGLDPVRDVDQMLIAGPQLRDSSEVIVVLQHRGREERIKQAIDALVSRDANGKWVDAGVAHAQADRAERIFIIPRPGIVVVTPPSAADRIIARGKRIGFPRREDGVAIRAHVVTPWRVLLGTGIQLPRSIKWARLELTPKAGGGVEVTVVAEDESEEHAKRNARDLERIVTALQQFNPLGLLGAFLGKQPRLIEQVDFHAQGTRIIGTVTATGEQIDALMGMIESMLPPGRLPNETVRAPR
jgi:hypothetical protein